MQKLKLFLRFTKLLLPYRAKWVAILVFGVLGMLLSLVNPYLTKLAIDQAIARKDLRLFILLVFCGAAAFLAMSLLNGLKEYLEKYINAKLKFDLSRKLFRHLEYLSLSWFQSKSTGEHLYKIHSDVERISHFLAAAPAQLVATFPKLIITIVIIFFLNSKIAIFSLCLVPLLYLPPYWLIKRRMDIWRKMFNCSQQIYKILQENFSHIQLVKAFAKETTEIRKYLKDSISNIRLELSNIRWDIFTSFSSAALDKILVGFIAFYGGYEVINGRLTLGTLSAILVYLAQLMGMQYVFIGFFQSVSSGFISCQRVAEVLDEKREVNEAPSAKSIVFEKPKIIFKNVSFGYRENNYVLKNISFTIENGSHIALVGTSGCGKTTILNLILRLYDLWEGRIFVSGEDLKGLKLKSLRSQMGVVLQEPFLWNDTITNNIGYGCGNAAKDEIIKIAQLAGVDDFVKELACGYETIIGENACKLSEGQKQKIAIARALIKMPKILILDEAMSAIDSLSEERIITQIKKIPYIQTLIIISHRLSTVASCDFAYFLKAPDTMVVDNPQALMQNNQDFYNLFTAQIGGINGNKSKNAEYLRAVG